MAEIPTVPGLHGAGWLLASGMEEIRMTLFHLRSNPEGGWLSRDQLLFPEVGTGYGPLIDPSG